jgi:hypothetical protein
MDLYLDSEKQIRKFLRLLLENKIDVTSGEVSKQTQLKKNLRDLKSSDAAADAMEEAEGDDEEVTADVPTITKKDVTAVTFDEVAKTFNVLRSGKSINDPQIKKSFKAYFDNLNAGEKQALYTFLTGMAELFVAGDSSEEAVDPASLGIRVRAASKEKKPTEKIKIKKTIATAEETGDEVVPIIVGECANKDAELQVLRQLRN